MTVKEVRELLGAQFSIVPDETLESLIKLIESVCDYVIATESVKKNAEYKDIGNHEP